MQFFCKQQANQANWWLPNGRTNICCSFGHLCLQDEEDIVTPSKPLFYKRCMDDTYVRRKKNETDELYNALKSYHQNVELTLEFNPTKFLDTEIIRSNDKITTQVYNKMRKYTATGFPSRFVYSIIDNFDSGKNNLIIPQWLFDERKTFTIHLHFSPSNESFVKTFVSKLNYFTNEKCKFKVVLNTRRVQSLFPSKDKANHYSCVINYIGETVRNAEIRWNEHEDKNCKSEPAKHLKENPTHRVRWNIISKAPENSRKCRVLEAYFIKTICLTLNEQLDNDILTLFRNGIT